MEKNTRQSLFSWALILALVISCLALGALQYRWIGEVSVAARERLRAGLESNLRDLSRDFNRQIADACRPWIPRDPVADGPAAEAEVSRRFQSPQAGNTDRSLFRTIALAEKSSDGLTLRKLNFATGHFESAEWPRDWLALREQMEQRLRPGPPPRGRALSSDIPLLEAPLWGLRRPGEFGPREEAWIIFELNVPYLRDVLLPQAMQRHLAIDGVLPYEIEVVGRPGARLWGPDLLRDADASIGILDVSLGSQPGGPPQSPDGLPDLRPPGPPPGPRGRWTLLVRNRAGSLEAVVSRARRLNILITSGILLLILATVAALVRYTRRAQRLAELQVEFVANVSHELRTPLTVIHTAAHNLRGAVASQPKQVERYGVIIQQESARLKELVEQVLQFASAGARLALREREPVSVSQVISEAARSLQPMIDEAGCVLHEEVDPSLPPVLGDHLALKQAVQNLIGNALKYGSASEKWIGVIATTSKDEQSNTVEIRVLDHGPGIPDEERDQIFQPFFRGRAAVRNQVHGAGLGLSLVKRVVEAHSGNIEVRSGVFEGAEFVVRLPAIPDGSYAHTPG